MKSEHFRKAGHQHHGVGRAPRPYVAFAATSQKEAERLYRAQNVIWIWLGVAAMMSFISYILRPDLGPVITTHYIVLDVVRETLFAVGGVGITIGVWTIRRAIEVAGHIFFSTGALLNIFADLAVRNTAGGHVISVVLLGGIALSSAFRAFFIIEWIGADANVAAHSDNSE